MLRQKLVSSQWGKERTTKQLSAKVTRHLGLLRKHGVIKKIPNRNSYHLTAKGKKIVSAVNAILLASTQQLMNIAA